MPILIDTSFLFALYYSKDKNNHNAQVALPSLLRETRILPAPVLVELFYMTRERLNYDRAILTLTAVREAYQIEPLTEQDMLRMEQVMSKYREARFDYVDTAVMAMSERLFITQIYTFDRRDFSIFRPRHCPALELLP
ncbi:MAG: PIN domain-containing protein [Anaerolineae bacterium]|nr:PIN domain-containing protein [Anaerolineae bacterium]